MTAQFLAVANWKRSEQKHTLSFCPVISIFIIRGKLWPIHCKVIISKYIELTLKVVIHAYGIFSH